MGKVIFWLGIVSLIIISIFNISWWYDVKVGCYDYLKLTGDAPNIQKADEFLTKVLDYIEKKNLTQGNSAIIFHTPSADLSIWYNQIKGAKETLEIVLQRKDASSISQLERDNALMKVREVVLDDGKEGVQVTAPPNISWFPHQGKVAWWWIFTCIFIIGGAIIWYVDFEKGY
ncbi:hypothetical protein L6279_03595 [Candidatus Parcubacteria bacterium]|nr:hypothetical protein [Patescibacteria group bacterium]MCG2693163.1 hypothetical protein [Candidatus Parcubacteria bacterium]